MDFEETWSKRLASGLELTCMAYDEDTTRLVTGNRDRIVQLWNFDSKDGLVPVFTVQLDSTVPKALGFMDNVTRDLYVFGLYNGQWYVQF